MWNRFDETISADLVIDIAPNNTAMEWDIYQISVETMPMIQGCFCEIRLNADPLTVSVGSISITQPYPGITNPYPSGYLVCYTGQGSKDTAVGPPDIVAQAGDQLNIRWIAYTLQGDDTTGHALCSAYLYYNENPVGTTYSSAH